MVPRISASSSLAATPDCMMAAFFSRTISVHISRRKPVSMSTNRFNLQGIWRVNHWGRTMFMARKAIFSLVGSRMARKLSATLFSGVWRDWKSRPMAAGPIISRVRRLDFLALRYLQGDWKGTHLAQTLISTLPVPFSGLIPCVGFCFISFSSSSRRRPVFSHMRPYRARIFLMLKAGLRAFRCFLWALPSDKIRPNPMIRARKSRARHGFSKS